MVDSKQVCTTEEEEQCATVYEHECQSKDEQVFTILFLSANTFIHQHNGHSYHNNPFKCFKLQAKMGKKTKLVNQTFQSE